MPIPAPRATKLWIGITPLPTSLGRMVVSDGAIYFVGKETSVRLSTFPLGGMKIETLGSEVMLDLGAVAISFISNGNPTLSKSPAVTS